MSVESGPFPSIYTGSRCLPAASGVTNIPLPCTGCDYASVCEGNSTCDLGNLPLIITNKRCVGSKISCEEAAGILGVTTGTGEQWTEFTSSDRCTIGQEGFCVRTQPAPANKLACCLGNQTDSALCGGVWCPSSCLNDPDVEAYCKTGTNMGTDQCKQFCPVGTLTNRANWCDSAVMQYCGSEPQKDSDPLCGCFKSGIPPRPSCFDAGCSTTGYQTETMMKDSQNCGTVCQQVVECVEANKCTIDNNKFIINCPGTPVPTPGGGGMLIPLNKASSTMAWVIGTIAILFILVVIVGVIIYVARGRQLRPQRIVEVKSQ